MNNKIRKTHKRKFIEYRYIIYLVVLISLLQFWTLKTYFQEIEIKIPEDLFKAPVEFPITELTLEESYKQSELFYSKTAEGQDVLAEENLEGHDQEQTFNSDQMIIEDNTTSIKASDIQDNKYTNGIEGITLSEIQKKIVLRALEMLDENIEYKYKYYPETGYPTENAGISTDVIAIVLRDCGYDLMELIYKDMSEHKEAYPMDIKGSDNINKYMDFRHVFFQETFFSRHALELPKKYIPGDENNNIQWQPGDIVFFQIDKDNPHKDLAGIISPHKNEDGIPLVIMNSKELGKVSEADVLLEYDIKGHYRYPYPEVE